MSALSTPASLEQIEFQYPDMLVTRSSLKKGDEVPLHAHSNHYGFVYVLSGRCEITTYSVLEQQEDRFQINLVSHKEYKPNDFAVISKRDNVHRIVALEDTVFLDAFSSKPGAGIFQQFLSVIPSGLEAASKPETDSPLITTRVIPLEEAGIQHLLDVPCKQVDVRD